MHEYRVGEPYIPDLTHWPEAGEYNYRSGQHELRLFLRRPSQAESDAVRHGLAEFAVVVEGDLLCFLYRFGDAIPWGDAPYSWHLVPAEQRQLPEVPASAESRALLTVILVDAESGLVRALRVVSLCPVFTTALHLAIREQAARPWPGDAAYDAQLAALYRRYPTTGALLAGATARTVGGA